MAKSLNGDLTKLMHALLGEAKETHKADNAEKGIRKGDFKLALEDRLAIFDRALRLQALELKLEEVEEGSAWNREEKNGSE